MTFKDKGDPTSGGTLRRTKVDWYNYLDSIGCNIMGLSNICSWCYITTHSDHMLFYSNLLEDIREILAVDKDYHQLALIQLTTNCGEHKNHEPAMARFFSIAFTTEVKGGHGNCPLMLYGLDLSKIDIDRGVGRDDDDFDFDGE